MDSEQTDQELTKDNKYAFAGYCAITSSLLSLPFLAVHLICDAQLGPMAIIVPLNILLVIVLTSCSLYALYRFKCFLNEYYEFHDIDKYVMPLIILSVMAGIAGIFSSTAGVISQIGPNVKIPSILVIIPICIVGGIICILFSVKLLNLPVSLHGMLKPYVYITIVAAVCFMVFLLGPVGVILGAVTDFMLGLILLKPKEEIQVEFV